MHTHSSIPAHHRKGMVLVLTLALAGLGAAFTTTPGGAQHAAEDPASLAATIFSYDGRDFIRTHTNLQTEAGASAVNTKLAHDTQAYKALARKHSYTGDVTVFGKRYDASYAPLTDNKGHLTGALFVGVPR